MVRKNFSVSSLISVMYALSYSMTHVKFKVSASGKSVSNIVSYDLYASKPHPSHLGWSCSYTILRQIFAYQALSSVFEKVATYRCIVMHSMLTTNIKRLNNSRLIFKYLEHVVDIYQLGKSVLIIGFHNSIG